MNERLREIEQQAMIYKEGSMGNGKYVFNKELFAELIVKECARLCVSKEDNTLPTEGDVCAYIILKHFGVE